MASIQMGILLAYQQTLRTAYEAFLRADLLNAHVYYLAADSLQHGLISRVCTQQDGTTRCPISQTPDEPGLNWAFYYLAALNTPREAQTWLKLAEVIRISLDDETWRLPPVIQSRLVSAAGSARLFYRSEMLTARQVLDQQRAALDAWGDALPVAERLWHHYTMVEALVRLREPEAARALSLDAQALAEDSGQTALGIMHHDAQGMIDYYFNDGQIARYEQAIATWRETEAAWRARSSGFDPRFSCYSIGWAYAEMGALDQAAVELERCKAEAQRLNAAYRAALQALGHNSLSYEENCFNVRIESLSNYALGFVYQQQRRYQAAVYSLTEAYNLLRHQGDMQYMAAALNILANVYRRQGDLESALLKNQQAAQHIQALDHPLQRHHIAQVYVRIYWDLLRRGRVSAVMPLSLHTLRWLHMRRVLKKPLLPDGLRLQRSRQRHG